MNNKNIFGLIPNIISEDDEMIPLLTAEEENEMNSTDVQDHLPILAVRNTVLFPGVILPITVGRKKSIKLVRNAYKGDRTIGVVAQENPTTEDPRAEDLYKVGTVARIIKMVVLPDGNTTIIIQGRRRFRWNEITQEAPYMVAKIELLEESFPKLSRRESKAIIQSLRESAHKIIKLSPELPPESQIAIDNIETAAFLTHFLCSNVSVDVRLKQQLLEINDGIQRSTTLLEFMHKEIQMLELKHEINHKAHIDIDQQQRDYLLRQQMKVLQDELGEDGPQKEIERLKLKAATKNWSENAEKHFYKEVNKLSRMTSHAPEYPVSLNYLELFTDLPWNHVSKDNFSLKRAQKVLDKDHYGLEKVKKRILEYLAVIKLKAEKEGEEAVRLRGPILCLYGPPGVGKTSLGKSIAKALGREYVRMSLGGVRDEAEIRGHRKTYIGAMPGKVISNINKVGTSNPVFILDEIDKLASDFRGDPSSALLEVLDPEQNNAFVDNYLEVDYDLSKVLFIATSNSLDSIQPALRDRMEIIEVNGYTIEEKIEIAKRHLIPKQKTENGLEDYNITFVSDAIKYVVEHYTRESGVRDLERKIGTIFRSIAKSIAFEEEYSKKITSDEVKKHLGTPIFESDSYEKQTSAGVVTGLAWTSVGGEILSIESVLSKGKGKLTLSGQLGDVMKESAIIALTHIKANAKKLSIDERIFDEYDLHIHVPAGAIPKDGPSAGITMFTSMASVFTQRAVTEKLAMTGEITLTGKVLPVGGIKEKILAAIRAGMKQIILCEKNRKDIDEITPEYLKGVQIHYVHHVDEVIAVALQKSKVKNPVDLTIIDKKIPVESNN